MYSACMCECFRFYKETSELNFDFLTMNIQVVYHDIVIIRILRKLNRHICYEYYLHHSHTGTNMSELS